MVVASKLLFRIPGQTSWTDLEGIEKERPMPETRIEVKDIATGNNHAGQKGQSLGKIQYRFVKQKYASA